MVNTAPTATKEYTPVSTTGEHAMRHFRELRTDDIIDSYTAKPPHTGTHRGRVLGTITAPRTGGAAAAVASPQETTLRLDCTVCSLEHTVTDSPWRLVAAVRQP